MMEAPKLPTIFRQTRVRDFDYKPLYYDESKERKKEILGQLNDGPSRTGKDEFRKKMRAGIAQSRPGQNRSSNIRLFAIIVLLFMIAYLIIQY